MSPSTALTTACSGAPSKLKVDSPLLAARPGRGALAAAWLMVWPLPWRTWARGSSPSSSSGARWMTGVGGASTVPSRWICGIGVAHAASSRARVAASGAVIRFGSIMGCTLRVLLRLCRRLLSLLAQPRAPLLDPAPDRLGLLGRGDVVGRCGGFGDDVAGGAGPHAPARAIAGCRGLCVCRLFYRVIGARRGRGRLPANAVEDPELEHPLAIGTGKGRGPRLHRHQAPARCLARGLADAE